MTSPPITRAADTAHFLRKTLVHKARLAAIYVAMSKLKAAQPKDPSHG